MAAVDVDDIHDQAPNALTTAVVSQDAEAAGAYTYAARFLPPGTYTVAFTCQGLADDPAANDTLEFVGPQTVDVVHGQVTEVDFGF